MKEEFPEVKEFTRLVKTSLFTSDLGRYVANALEFATTDKDGKSSAFVEQNVWFSDAPLLNMFTFPMLEGTTDALTEPNSVVLTESIARKYFGDEPALGKELKLNSDILLKVTGVIKDVPANSHLQFDVLISFSTLRHRVGDMYNSWGWAVFYNYVLMEDNVDLAGVRAKFPALKDKFYGPEDQSPNKTGFDLQPIRDIHLRSGLGDEQSPVGNERVVYFLSILAVFILVVAWINYINLSTAKALQRSKEVGLRKTVGASRIQLIMQFLLDTTLINIFALLLAVALTVVSWSAFEQLIGKQIRDSLFIGDSTQWIVAGIIFVFGVLLCGLYPALTLSSFNPAVVLKGGFVKTSSGALLRKIMVSFQYVLAVTLIAGTITIYLQLSYMRSSDTGFTKDQVVVTVAPAVYDSVALSRITYFTNEVMKLRGVMKVTATSDVPGRPIVEGAPVMRLNATSENEMFVTSVVLVDTLFFSTFDINILAGRMFTFGDRMDFRLRYKDEAIPVFVNEEFVRRLRSESPNAALEERLTFWWGPEQRYAKIIGVVANHHQVSLKEQISPVVYAQPWWLGAKYFATRMEAGSTPKIKEIQAAYLRAFPGHSFSYFFLDEHFDRQYHDDQQFGKIFNVFTGLAIFITCLGLLGLSVFSVLQRTKEVSIRKVLGAPSSAILYLFSLDFIRALLISYVIAAPLVYWAGENWLQNFPNRIPLRWEIYVLPPVLLIAITLITVISVSVKTMIEAPVKALRQE
ncbi:MAG TPA: FtsX-like permease family protein [Cyclobacteriaceae bacterium]|nr:FtsX-like permease family protein [Cyclobacteriaceae bacterium]